MCSGIQHVKPQKEIATNLLNVICSAMLHAFRGLCEHVSLTPFTQYTGPNKLRDYICKVYPCRTQIRTKSDPTPLILSRHVSIRKRGDYFKKQAYYLIKIGNGNVKLANLDKCVYKTN